MHPDQVFVDCDDAHGWVYDPIKMLHWLCAAQLALFITVIVWLTIPLWPPILGECLYYFIIAAGGFFMFEFVLDLPIFRLVVFCISWILTGSKAYLWIFPNFSEDVGFLASFWPLCTVSATFFRNLFLLQYIVYIQIQCLKFIYALHIYSFCF